LNLNLKQNYKAYLLLGYAFLLLIHFIVKDTIFPISTIFYSFPIPIIIGIGIIISFLYFKNKAYFYLLIIIQFSLVFYWLNNFYYAQYEKINSTNTSKILYWNVAKKDKLPIDIIIKETKLNKPEILAFVEATYVTKDDIKQLQDALPGYTFKDLRLQMLIGVKGKINSEKQYTSDKSYNVYLINTTINNKTINFILSDVYAYPFINKEPPLNAILQIANSNNASFIVGDFNTPYESVHFSNYFKNYRSFHSYGKGFTATWPLEIPFFEIDHIWITNKLSPISLDKKYYNVSDHKLLIAEFE
jgi:endonuclease/exonuclease/phosphatase (EEP) superfamily protein YafD